MVYSQKLQIIFFMQHLINLINLHLKIQPLNDLIAKWFCMAIFLTFSPSFIHAQCTVHDADLVGIASGGNKTINLQSGQTFLACADGEVTSISVSVFGGSRAGTYELYIDEDPGAGVLLTATPAASTVQSTNITTSATLTFDLDTPYPVSDDGTLYRFSITNTSNSYRLARENDNYADGTLIDESGNQDAAYDLDFEVSIQASPTPIPTLSEWSLIILALLLMTLGTLYLVQPSVESGFENSSPRDLGER